MKVERILTGTRGISDPEGGGERAEVTVALVGPAGMPTAPGSARPCPPHWRPRAGSLRACRGQGEAPPPNGPLGCLPSDAGRRACLWNGPCLCVRVYLWHGCMLGVDCPCPCRCVPVHICQCVGRGSRAQASPCWDLEPMATLPATPQND